MTITNAHLDRSKFVSWTPRDGGKILMPPESTDEHILRAFQDHAVRADYEEAGVPGLCLGSVPDPDVFSHHADTDWTFKISTWVIKNPGSNEYKIPFECARFHETIKAMAEDQHARSPLAQFKYATLTARHYFVYDHTPQVSDEWHVDDTKQAELFIRQLEGHPLTRQLSVQAYIASDHTGTQIQAQQTPCAKRIFNDAADERDQKLQLQLTRFAEPHEINIITNYTNHRPRPVIKAGLRSFIGLVYLPTRPMEDMVARMARPLPFRSSLEF